MAHAGGFVHLYHDSVDSLPPRLQYPLFRGIVEGMALAPEAKRRILRDGGREIRSRMRFRHEVGPLGVNSLPWSLWNVPSLIDFEHWAQVNEGLRRKDDW